MASTLKLGKGNWGVKEDSLLAYSDQNNNFIPLPFDFSRASSATVVNKSGLIESVTSGVPRIDFSDDTNGALLLEPQSTNLLPFSEDFSQWSVIGTPTITSNYGISPDGTQNSTRIQFNNNDRIYEGASVSGDITYSVYLKGVGEVRLRDSANIYALNITLTDQWVRYEYSFNGTITNVQIEQDVGTSDLEIWGAQVEQQSYATSYIPTAGATATRVQDICANGGSLASINSTEGTLYFEGSALSNDGTSRSMSIFQNVDNFIKFQYSSISNRVDFVAFSAGAVSCNITKVITNTTENAKFGLKWKLNDFALWINGVEVGTDTNGNTPIGMDKISFTNEGGSSGNFLGKTKALVVYKEALSDTELATLTTI